MIKITSKKREKSTRNHRYQSIYNQTLSASKEESWRENKNLWSM